MIVLNSNTINNNDDDDENVNHKADADGRKKKNQKKGGVKEQRTVLKKETRKKKVKSNKSLQKKVLKKDVPKKDVTKKVHKKEVLKEKIMMKKAMKKNVPKKDIPDRITSSINSDVSFEDIEYGFDNVEEESFSKTKRTKSRSRWKRRQEIQNETEKRSKQYEEAVNDYQSNPGMSFNACAKKHKVNNHTLKKLLDSGEAFKGSGRVLTVLHKEEEKKISDHIVQRLKLGYSLTFYELRYLIQEALIKLCQANPDRTSPWENHFPHDNFVHNFAERNNLVLRSTMELSKARSMLSLEALMSWYQDTAGALVNHPDFADCWKNPQRILNQDECGLQVGASKVKVLAPRGVDHVLYSKGGGSHEHVSLSVTANAAGECVGTRVIYKGKEFLSKVFHE